MIRPVYMWNDGDICGIKSVNADDNNKTLTFIYDEMDDTHKGFNETNLKEILNKYDTYKLYALETNGNYFTDTIEIDFIDDDSMNDRVDLNIKNS